MKGLIVTVCAACACFIAQAAEQPGLLPNSSFENAPDGNRPVGWAVFTTPDKLPGEFFVNADTAGAAARTGENALEFYFPGGEDVVQAVWMCDPKYAGMPVEPGLYRCTFWIKASGMEPGFHLWVSAVGFSAEGKRSDKVQRSEYLNGKKLPDGEWMESSFYFDIRPEDNIATIAPTIVFKTNPDGKPHPVSPATRILIDDLVIERDQ